MLQIPVPAMPNLDECRKPFGGGVGQQNLWVFPTGSVRERNKRTVQPTDFQDKFLKPGGTQIVQDLLAGRKNSDPRNLLAKWNGKSACFRKRFEKNKCGQNLSNKIHSTKTDSTMFSPKRSPLASNVTFSVLIQEYSVLLVGHSVASSSRLPSRNRCWRSLIHRSVNMSVVSACTLDSLFSDILGRVYFLPEQLHKEVTS